MVATNSTSPPPAPTLDEWISAHGRFGFTQCQDGKEACNANSAATVDLSSDARAFDIRYTSSGVGVTINLGGHHIDHLCLPGCSAVLIGPGHIDRITLDDSEFDGATTLQLTGGLDVATVDAVSVKEVVIETPQCQIDELIVGGNVLRAGQNAYARQLVVVGTELTVSGSFVTDRLAVRQPAGSLTITGGWVRSKDLPSQALTARNGGIGLAGAARGRSVRLEQGGAFELTGADAVAEEFVFDGPDGRVFVKHGRLEAPTFVDGSTLSLTLNGGEASMVTGLATLSLHGHSKVGGSRGVGLVFYGIDVKDNFASVENVNFFRLNPSHLSVLQDAERVSGWWPSVRLRKAVRSVDGGVQSPSSRPAARARYWVSVERLLKEKSPSGRDLAFAHFAAEDSRRCAASWRHTERHLLALSRIGGYGARIGVPVLWWLVGTAVAATFIRMLATGICFDGCSVTTAASLYWDVLVAPVTFVRPLDEGSDLARLVDDHLVAQMITFIARAFGTWMLLSIALAVRRYVRTT